MPTINDDYVNALKNLANHGSFPTLIQMRVEEIEFDHCIITLAAHNRLLQPFGIIHGGVLATLIDTATYWAVFMRLPQDTGLVNIDLKLNYLKTANPGLLTAEGHCIRAGRTISYAEARVTNEAGDLLAHGTSTLMALPGKGFDFGVSKFQD